MTPLVILATLALLTATPVQAQQVRHDTAPCAAFQGGAAGVNVTRPGLAVRNIQRGGQQSQVDIPGSRNAVAADALARAWQYLVLGNLAWASQAFDLAAQAAAPALALEGQLGQAYVALRRNQWPQARDLLAPLIAADFRTDETLPALLDVLRSMGDTAGFAYYLAWLPEDQRHRFRRPPLAQAGPGLRAALAALPPHSGRDVLRGLLSRHSSEVSACLDPAAIFDAARRLGQVGDPARDVMEELRRCPKLDEGLRVAVAFALIKDYPTDSALAVLDAEAALLSPGMASGLRQQAVDLLKTEMGRLDARDPNREILARRVLERMPGDIDARAVLAWAALDRGKSAGPDNGDLAEARSRFQALHTDQPEVQDFVYGLALVQLESGRPEDAVRLAQAEGNPPQAKLWEVYRLGLLAMAGRDLRAGRFQEVLDRLPPVTRHDPDDRQARELAAWALKGLGRSDEALALFDAMYQEDRDPKTAGKALALLEASGRTGEAVARAKILAENGTRGARREAGALLARQGLLEQAALADPEPAAPYAGQASGFAETGIALRTRTGDAGFSRLTEISHPTLALWPATDGSRFSLQVTPRFLDAGSAPSSPYMGSYYRLANDSAKRQAPIDNLWVVSPSLIWRREGATTYKAEVGATPLGGPVTPLPSFQVAAGSQNWRVSAFQRPVTDSLLSYVGQRDPYSGRTWGRVVSLGATGGGTWRPLADWFWDFNGGAAYYYGQEVAENWMVEAGTAAGRHLDFDWVRLDAGVYAQWRHFNKNLNHFTTGNGGYYSPQMLFSAGPFIRLRSPSLRPYGYDLEASIGHFADQNDSQAKYPLLTGSLARLSDTALSEALGRYGATSSEKISFRLAAKVETLLTPYLSLGAAVGVSNSADYTELTSLLQVRVSFEKRHVVDRQE